MKKFKLFLAAASCVALTFTSCTKDNESPVISDAKLSTSTPNVGDTVTITATISDVEGLSSVAVGEKAGASSTFTELKSFETSGGSYSLTYDYVVSSTATEGNKIELQITVVDDNKKEDNVNTVTKVLSMTVTVPVTSTPFSMTKTGAIMNKNGSCKSGWSLSADAEVNSGDNADLRHDPATVSDWEPKVISQTGATYVMDSTYDYDNATVESATSSFAAGTSTSTIPKATTGMIVIVKMASGNYAVLKVTDANGSDSSCSTAGNDQKMTFEYKKN